MAYAGIEQVFRCRRSRSYCTLAKELKADLLLIDERIGKQFAGQEHITCKGVVGVLIEAKQKGLIPLLKPLLDDLIKNLQFRLSEHIYRLALQKANELS
ncbi:DUF3368 domain-containing protein [Ilyomonas limi]|uniref:DUF3368 domain-containing protein n=1 Tax=Ilyomonas limi TaxID=2575867 RepID=A0A4U3KZZ1_9BACT|nr:DUF3368 domain-containing protein [Ilyomonas limi]